MVGFSIFDFRFLIRQKIKQGLIMSLPEVLILGAGGHAKVLIDSLQLSGRRIKGALEAAPALWGHNILGVPVLGNDDTIFNYKPSDVELVNGLGSTHNTSARQKLFETWKSNGYSFANVIHPSAVISKHCQLGEGIQIMAGAILNAGAKVNDNSLINTAAIIEHDCKIAAHCHIAPSASLSGGVKVGQGSHIGLGARVLQNLTLGEACLVGAGAVVIHPVERGQLVVGVPAAVKS